jgi:hypothetical protein
MEIKVYGQPEPKKAILKLESYGDDALLNVVDSDGYRITTLLGIKEEGFTRYTSCDRYAGFALNEKGQIKEVKDGSPDTLSELDNDRLIHQVRTIFNAFDTSIQENKIRAIKITRLLCEMGLKEAKDWVEANFF